MLMYKFVVHYFHFTSTIFDPVENLLICTNADFCDKIFQSDLVDKGCLLRLLSGGYELIVRAPETQKSGLGQKEEGIRLPCMTVLTSLAATWSRPPG